MTNMEFADLLKTLAPSLPCGEDLEYDPEFLQLQQAAVGKSEQQFGATIIPAQPPDWRNVEKLALGLLERTRDLRVIAYLTQAWTETRGVPGYAEGVALAASTLDRYWEDVHPRLDVYGEEDPMPRVNALASLGDPQGCARSVRSAMLTDDLHGALSLRDAEALLDGSKTESDYPGGRLRLVESLRQAWLGPAPAVLAVSDAAAALRRIQEHVTTRLGVSWSPDYTGVLRSLDVVQHVWRDMDSGTGVEPETSQDEPGQEPTGEASASPAAAPRPVVSAAVRWQEAQITSREEAAAMLSKVCAYFEAYEPSHPAPYLIRRAQQLIPLGFHEILRNLAPQGLDQFEAWIPRDAEGQTGNGS